MRTKLLRSAKPGERVLEIAGLCKTYGSVRANHDISLHVERGEIVALLGENGAGKSTLVKQIFGLVDPDAGTISISGDSRPVTDPADAISRGVGMVHQHFQLVPVMTVAENVVLGNEPLRKGAYLDLRAARLLVTEISRRHGLDVDPDAIVEDLPVGTQQRVEIIKALSRSVDLLIMDEPTAVLTPEETDELLAVMRDLAAAGTAIIFISHKLREVLAVADRVYVLRRGAVVGEVETAQTDVAHLAQLMVGRSVVLQVDKGLAHAGSEVLRIADLHVLDDRRLGAVNGVDLVVRAGEIVGVAGVEGNGQRELVEAIAGMRRPSRGTIVLGGVDVTGEDPLAAHRAGIGHIPEDREKHGLVASFSIADNLILNRYDEPDFRRGFLRDTAAIGSNARRWVEEYDIRTPDASLAAQSLSGGNKQKVVVAREMSAEPRLLLAAQPTRGVDVGSIEFIHRRIVEARDGGAAVLLVSAELDEVLALSDRIAVMHGGRLVRVLEAADADRAEIGALMAGSHLGADER